jgi:isopenicillin N synthase-like dioxygenase
MWIWITAVYLLFSTSSALKIIDISPMMEEFTLDEDKLQNMSNHLQLALAQDGAFYLTGHMLDISRMLEIAPRWFRLDKSNSQFSNGRGFIPVGGESGSHLHELKEAFSMGNEWEEGQIRKNILEQLNVWPDEDPEMIRNQLNRIYEDFINVAKVLVQAIGLALGVEPDKLLRLCSDSDKISILRLFHYFPEQVGSTGSSPHTDWGFLTLIAQDSLGLQVSGGVNDWIDVPVIPGALVVNAGDYLSLVSSGRVKSPLHRVILPKDELHRYSYVMFFYPNYDSRIDLEFGSFDSNSQHLSLLTDQTGKDTNGGKAIDQKHMLSLPFGQFISEKWNSVKRRES